MPKRKSIFYKILLLMVLLSIVTGGLVLSMAIIEQTQFMEKAIIKENKLLADAASQIIEAGYIKKQCPFSTLKQISESENILFLWVVKPDGKIYLADNTEMWGKKIEDPSLGTKEITVKDSLFYKTNEKIKLVIHPLDMGESGKQWELYLGVSLRSVKAARNKMILTSFGFFIIITLLAALLSFYLAKSVTKPLKQLTEVANKISMGDIKVKIDVKSKDEIGDLAKAFKRMVNSLKILMKGYKQK